MDIPEVKNIAKNRSKSPLFTVLTNLRKIFLLPCDLLTAMAAIDNDL